MTMATTTAARSSAAPGIERILPLLRCPESGAPLRLAGDRLATLAGDRDYALSASGIPLFAARFCSREARQQEAHYQAIASAYVENLAYPHTEEYTASLDRALLDAVGAAKLGTVAEICCGRGEAFLLLPGRIDQGVGVDISVPMLEAAQRRNPTANLAFVQGDATRLPLASAAFDTVFMLGGIHHVGDRRALFAEVARILKAGGWFYFREPVSDFAPWRWLRAVIYRPSPSLDRATERPLLWRETVPLLEQAGLPCRVWRAHGILGFCLFMSSDVLVFSRLFRFLPGVCALTRGAARLDEALLAPPGLGGAGLRVVGAAQKEA
jgi:SAM-dependent methyltransferase